MSLLSVVLATETEIVSAFLLPETAVSRSRIAEVGIDRLSIISACAWRRSAGGGEIITSSVVSLPRDTAYVRSTEVGDVQFLNVSDVEMTFQWNSSCLYRS